MAVKDQHSREDPRDRASCARAPRRRRHLSRPLQVHWLCQQPTREEQAQSWIYNGGRPCLLDEPRKRPHRLQPINFNS
jgi:hypothetical protein